MQLQEETQVPHRWKYPNKVHLGTAKDNFKQCFHNHRMPPLQCNSDSPWLYPY